MSTPSRTTSSGSGIRKRRSSRTPAPSQCKAIRSGWTRAARLCKLCGIGSRSIATSTSSTSEDFLRPIEIDRLGADPEVFFARRSGAPQSVEGLIGGSKKNPRPMDGMEEGFYIQEDNVAAEYNIPPASDPERWARNIVRGFQYVRDVAKKHRLKPLIAADADFPIPQVMTPHALTLGCDPDFNAWLEDMNPRPEAPFRMRTAAAHLHVSWASPDDEQRWELIRAMDVFLGLPSILVTKPNRRRELYGRAGACRLKPYGVEYRVLDNFYINSEKLATAVGNKVFVAADAINHSPILRAEIRAKGNEIQEAI